MTIINYDGISGINSITATGSAVQFYNASGVTASITVGQLALSQQSSTQRNTGIGTAVGTLIYNSTTQQLEVYGGPTGWSGGLGIPFTATGGNLADGLLPGNGYRYHTFGSTGSFVATGSPKPIDILLVAPGGGGGGANSPSGTDGGAGAGSGGLVLVSGYTISSGTYTITIGGAGAGGPSNSSPGTTGGDVTITNPLIGTLTAKGGGRGGAGPLTPNPGGPGGSGGGEGGGGGTSGGPAARGLAIQPSQSQGIFSNYYLQYGNDGGNTTNAITPYHGSGGGGAGGVGGGGNSGGPGLGGDGRQFSQFIGPIIGVPALNPLSGFFAGGGGGGAWGPLNNPKAGGNGGGPGGATNTSGTVGTQYTGSGGGGGGGGNPSPAGSGGNGGAGIVVIRYLSV